MPAIMGHELTPTDYLLGVIIMLIGLYVLYRIYLYLFNSPVAVTALTVSAYPTSSSANTIKFGCNVPATVTSVTRWVNGKFSLSLGTNTITGTITSATISSGTTVTVSGTVDSTCITAAVQLGTSNYTPTSSDSGTITPAA